MRKWKLLSVISLASALALATYNSVGQASATYRAETDYAAPAGDGPCPAGVEQPVGLADLDTIGAKKSPCSCGQLCATSTGRKGVCAPRPHKKECRCEPL